jgi:hypothetical protein
LGALPAPEVRAFGNLAYMAFPKYFIFLPFTSFGFSDAALSLDGTNHPFNMAQFIG